MTPPAVSCEIEYVTVIQEALWIWMKVTSRLATTEHASIPAHLFPPYHPTACCHTGAMPSLFVRSSRQPRAPSCTRKARRLRRSQGQ
jgi:hypothetical protein